MEHQLGHEEEEAGNHVTHILGGLVVAGVESVDGVVLGAVACEEVVRTYGVGFETDAEELGFETRLHVGQVFGEDFVEALFENLAVAIALYGEVLASVVNPDVHDTGVALCLTHGIGDAAAALGVLNPEVADGLVGIGQRKVATLGVGEAGGVEVELQVVLLCPVNPSLEVGNFYLVAVYKLAAELSVNLVEVEAMVACEQGLYFLYILTQLVDVACLAGVIACGLDATGKS